MKHSGQIQMEGRRRHSKDHARYIVRDALRLTLFMRTPTYDSTRVLPLKLTDPFRCQGGGLEYWPLYHTPNLHGTSKPTVLLSVSSFLKPFELITWPMQDADIEKRGTRAARLVYIYLAVRGLRALSTCHSSQLDQEDLKIRRQSRSSVSACASLVRMGWWEACA